MPCRKCALCQQRQALNLKLLVAITTSAEDSFASVVICSFKQDPFASAGICIQAHVCILQSGFAQKRVGYLSGRSRAGGPLMKAREQV